MTMMTTTTELRYCNACEAELTEDNTTEYGGFDGSNYLASRTYFDTNQDEFTKCDGCFDADNDRALESMYE